MRCRTLTASLLPCPPRGLVLMGSPAVGSSPSGGVGPGDLSVEAIVAQLYERVGVGESETVVGVI